MNKRVRVGLIDSGVSGAAAQAVVAARRFVLSAEDVQEQPPLDDTFGHGSTLAGLILHAAPAVQLVSAQVFAQGVTTPAAVAAGLRWTLAQGVQLVNLSLGLRHDRTVLRAACAEAQAQGVLLIAAAPARGGPVYPAAYPGVLRASGDARCQPGEFSWLATAQVDIGACPRGLDDSPTGGGASCAAARVTGLLAAYLAAGGCWSELPDWLEQHARYHGPERRT